MTPEKELEIKKLMGDIQKHLDQYDNQTLWLYGQMLNQKVVANNEVLREPLITEIKKIIN